MQSLMLHIAAYLCCLVAGSYGGIPPIPESIKEYHRCKELANNGNCDARCLGFDSFEQKDCENVEFEKWDFLLLVNAHPFMHSYESWKIVHEAAERRFYGVHMTIDSEARYELPLGEEWYTVNVQNCIMKIKEWQLSLLNKTIENGVLKISGSSGEPTILENCSVVVPVTFYVPRVDSPEVIELRRVCEQKDNNGVCDLMCRGFRRNSYSTYEVKDCPEEFHYDTCVKKRIAK